ncbi:hypothetical protein BBJ28_00004508 [Nothophytophthora sp. Chile5]|nr:hypothetical protein BBJ28_00004508 [Nothophytophthora sp. Chile5]
MNKHAAAQSHNVAVAVDCIGKVATQKLLLFSSEGAKSTPVPLNVVQCLHARDFHRAIGFAPVRCAVDLHTHVGLDAMQRQLARCEAATRDADSFFVRVSNVSKGSKIGHFQVINGHGQDALASGSSSPLLLSALLPDAEDITEDLEEQTKAKKKKGKKKVVSKKAAARQAQLDTWGDDQEGESGSKEEQAARFLPSLEYGDIANVELLLSLAPLDNAESVSAPVVIIPSPSSSVKSNRTLQVHCEALVMVPVDSFMETALSLLRERLHDQLKELSKRLEAVPEAVACVSGHQFPLIDAAFPLTLLSCSSGDESLDDTELLEKLHHAFLQPVQQSLFRVSRGCSLAQQAEWISTSDVLVNVHEGIPSSGVGPQSQQALVDGFYGYYHYLQQHMNDKGWGCAYRSLQTLASWLFMQHYTQQRSLSHHQIQQALVQMGDKPARFQGSTEWIGSLEVGYVLDELFGVTFRSLTVASGPQLVDVARELLHHFETQGTPVMMGGGQLAFTLLGVDYDANAGVCAFLTLDPHYTGDDDLTVIQHQTVTLEGYKAVPCSWRKTSSFAKNSFYNLCLPQRPSIGF